MPEFDTDTLLPPKHGVMTPFAKFTWAFIVLLLLGSAWLVMHRFNLGGFRGEQHYLEQARRAVAAKDWEQAARDLSSAHRLAPDSRKVTLSIIHFLKVTGADAGGLLQMIEKLNKYELPSPEMQVLMGRTLFRLGRFEEAGRVYEGLPEPVKSETDALDLKAGLLNAGGRSREAAEFARRALLSMPDSPEKEFRIASEDAKHPFHSIEQKGRQALWRIAESGNEFSPSAISQLANAPELTAREGRQLLKLLDEHPSKGLLPVRLEVVSTIARLQPELRSALFAAEVKRFRDTMPAEVPSAKSSDNPEVRASPKPANSNPVQPPDPAQEPDGDLAIVCRWLAKEKQHELLLELVPLQRALQSTELFSALARALGEDERWVELKQLLTENKPPVDAIRVSLWLATAESHLQSDMKRSRTLLSSAIDAAGKIRNPELLIAAALAAEKLNEHDIALAAYQAMAVFDEERAVLILQNAYREALQLKDTAALLTISRTLHALLPVNHALSERLSYLRLICGEEMEVAALGSMKKSNIRGAAAMEEGVPHALLKALSLHRFADAQGLKRVLEELPSIEHLPPGQRAVAAGLLAIAGKAEAAFVIAETVPQSLLLPEELALLKLAL